jgi:hypothetical protein
MIKAVVVYESHWGNTAAIARAIGEGLGPDTRVVTTDQATPEVISGADLLVVGAPLLAFSLPTEQMRQGLPASQRKAPTPPDISHPSLRSWLEGLPPGHGRSAAFETRLWWSPGSATSRITRGLERAGYPAIDKPHRFIVKGAYGPLREGEIDKARQWGADLVKAMQV